ncbi:MAG: ABC transporter permease [Planctomycetes bacterium]|nr:ABC transporter permease [Planctomycetota bacterium]
MTDENETDPAAAEKTETFASTRAMWGRLARLTLKELRETLRDRRTILTLVLMPLIVYPLLSLAFQKFLITSLPTNTTEIHLIGVETDEAQDFVEKLLKRGEAILYRRRHPQAPQSTMIALHFEVRKVSGDLNVAVSESLVDLGIRVPARVIKDALKRAREDRVQRRPINRLQRTEKKPALIRYPFELVHLRGSGRRNRALAAVEQALDAVNDEHRVGELEIRRVPRHDVPVQMRRTALKGTRTSSPYSLSALIPLILILMTITGAVYPAIDLTAGERERGTLEMLIAAPVPRLGLLVAKYAAVLFVAVLTATVNLVGMTVTILATGLGPLLFGEAGLSLFTVAAVFGLMVLFAAFFSAVLLIFTSFARSFKEAQAYLIPLMLVSIAPGMMSMIPDLTLDGPLMVVPLANIVLLARDLFEDTVLPGPAVIVVLSTAAYAVAALTLAARIFGTDAILYGSHGSWSDLFRRPEEPPVALVYDRKEADLPLEVALWWPELVGPLPQPLHGR